MDATEIKRRVPIDTILRHYGSVQDREGRWRCLFPERHHNGDAHHSVTTKDDRASCWSQQCFGEKGADVFELVGLMDGLSNFMDQKRRVCEIGGIVDTGNGNGQRREVATYDYTDEDGTLLFQVVRYEPKDFRQRRPDGKGRWVWDVHDVRLVLFRLPDVVKAETVLIVEGEKDVETANRLGLPVGWAATCNPMGAGKWRPEYSDHLLGKRVVILPDADDPGRRHGEQVARSLEGKAAAIRTLALPHGKDLSEWGEADGSAEGLQTLLGNAETWNPDQSKAQVNPWRCSLDLLSEPPAETAWLIHGLVPSESVVLFSGREGTMKTWLALEWARAIAEGTTWLDRECEAGSVLYLDAEMPGDLFRSRLHAVGGSLNLNVWRWQDAEFPTRLDDPGLLEAARSHRLIVIDTLKRFMTDLEENSSDDMAKVTGCLRQLTCWGCTVLAIHHAPKDETKPGYRGSTELGAGVDIALTVEKRDKDGAVSLAITAGKTRYANDPRVTLRVERTDTRPLFYDASGEAQAAKQAALAADLSRLEAVIGTLFATNGRTPNQSEVIKAAQDKALGARRTILGRLRQGEGVRWRSVPDGHSRVYELLSTCPPCPPLGARTEWTEALPPREPVRNLTGDINADRGDKRLSDLSTLSRDLGENRVDNGTEPAEAQESLLSYPVGTRIRFDGGLGYEETGIVEGLTTWNQFPGQTCYRVKGRTIPQSRVLEIEGNP
jgi:KaiC/GvpD/RAD55 family RecA-like ATPase/5S rRNA maturation endonuclease (ribonuclease M5)